MFAKTTNIRCASLLEEGLEVLGFCFLLFWVFLGGLKSYQLPAGTPQKKTQSNSNNKPNLTPPCLFFGFLGGWEGGEGELFPFFKWIIC